MPSKHKPPRHLFVVVKSRPLTKEDREVLTALGKAMLAHNFRVGGCGCCGTPWISTRKGHLLDNLRVTDVLPEGSDTYVKVEPD